MTPNRTSAAQIMLASTVRRIDVSESFIGPENYPNGWRSGEGGPAVRKSWTPPARSYDDGVPCSTTPVRLRRRPASLSCRGRDVPGRLDAAALRRRGQTHVLRR